jgi:hypothetical protein
LGERVNGIHEVVGSNPIVSTILLANKGGTAGISLSSLKMRGFSFSWLIMLILSVNYFGVLGQLLLSEKVIAHER